MRWKGQQLSPQMPDKTVRSQEKKTQEKSQGKKKLDTQVCSLEE